MAAPVHRHSLRRTAPLPVIMIAMVMQDLARQVNNSIVRHKEVNAIVDKDNGNHPENFVMIDIFLLFNRISMRISLIDLSQVTFLIS